MLMVFQRKRFMFHFVFQLAASLYGSLSYNGLEMHQTSNQNYKVQLQT